MARSFAIAFIIIGICVTDAYSARLESATIEPIQVEGIEYRIPNTVEKMGIVQAFKIGAEKPLWEQKIYNVYVFSGLLGLEEDVQWIFISSVDLFDGKLHITNEAGNQYYLSPESREVEPFDSNPILNASTLIFFLIAYAPSVPFILIAFIVWIFLRKRKRHNKAAENNATS